jgi:hypothetical protein
VVPYSAPTGALLSGYLAHRATISRARGQLFLSESRRNYGQPLSLWTWSKVIRRVALTDRGPAAVSTRHLCLTGLARMGWELHAIATFAGHRHTDSTMTYIHLSGRDLAEKLSPRHGADPLLARGHAHSIRPLGRGDRPVTATRIPAASDGGGLAAWTWPLDLAGYDPRALVTGAEARVLGTLGIEQVRRLGLTPQGASKRLVEPLAHARDCLHWTPGTSHQRRFACDAAGLILIRCGELSRSYWGWSDEDWAGLINRSGAEFRRLWGGQIGPNARPFLIAYAYLLGGFTAFDQVGRFQRPTLARRIFGGTAVDDAVGKVLAVLGGWGYQRGPDAL